MHDIVHRHSREPAPRQSGHRPVIRGLFATLGLLAVVGVSGAAAAPTDEVDVLHAFEDQRPDVPATELPEGVAVDFRGNVYATLGPPFFVGGGYGAVVKFGADGSRQTLVEFPDGPAPAGVVVDAAARVYFAVPDPGGASAGVYRVTHSGDAERIEGTEAMAVPNGLALDRRGSLFVSDSGLGEIWRISWRARVGLGHSGVGPWLSHPLLAGCDRDQIGANGIAFHRGDVYVANSERGLLVRVPVLRDGSPGDPVVLAGDEDCQDTDDLYSLDGIAIDIHGRVYAAVVLQNRLVRIDPRTGTATELLDEGDGLWNPASIAFGSTRGDRARLFIANYAVLAPEPAASLGPAVLTYRAGTPGWPFR